MKVDLREMERWCEGIRDPELTQEELLALIRVARAAKALDAVWKHYQTPTESDYAEFRAALSDIEDSKQ
jgi:tryptophan 2,3-dioxygenase